VTNPIRRRTVAQTKTSSNDSFSANHGYLLHPNLLETVPLRKSITARLLHQRINETLEHDPNNDPSVSVVIRAFNEAAKLELLFEDIRNQLFSSGVEIVVVDNGSSDSTAEVAKHHGPQVVTLQQSDFSYPKSLNVGVDAASNDVVLVTVAHARLSNVHNLRHQFASGPAISAVAG
jgi:cellulose synthase/poly-beta-1,6-N-acetylglucosamine synthase-like glycosyltransferase